jgi:hypothetical protein
MSRSDEDQPSGAIVPIAGRPYSLVPSRLRRSADAPHRGGWECERRVGATRVFGHGMSGLDAWMDAEEKALVLLGSSSIEGSMARGVLSMDVALGPPGGRSESGNRVSSGLLSAQ